MSKKLGVVRGSEADISRIRNAELSRFSIDRLVRILNGLDQHVRVTVGPSRRRAARGLRIPPIGAEIR